MRLKVLLIIILLILLNGVKAWQPDPEILGVWSGRQEVFAEFKKGTYKSPNEEDFFLIEFEIKNDGSVTGKVGDAVMVNCRCERNRGWLGKLLDIKTDYIIKGGYLLGKICAADKENKRNFTIPFNLKSGHLKGGFMQIYRWKYPNPLFPRLWLEKQGNK